MEFSPAIGITGAFWCVTIAVHLAGILIVLFRWRESNRAVPFALDRRVSILRPVCGMENNIEETLASTFTLSYPRYEILFCVASPSDPVIPLVERLMAANPAISARLLVGDDRASGNP